ncbi:hypothetical protein OPV22_020944 [Ensete ventricosum]|uniref:CCT domain-containing protein n=1 Tax=Ensete ventricosum TaxID=4639 RepID=A0AAV8QPH1_ENSVE|nr:hypothetical protein OPV22_020944 [Ensete ventricosum]
MFHSFLSSNGDGSLHHPVSSSVAHGLLPLPSPSPPHTSGCYLHRSSSTHSLAFHHRHLLKSIDAPPQPAYSSSPSSSSCDRLNFNVSPVRRVVSTGDLQGMHGVHESPRVGRYSAEERKERIERYRSKRHQRNFHKKITYACRKTLADGRPRVRGRFVRNGETETEVETETEATAGNSLECFSYGNDEQNQSRSMGGEWSSQLQAALETDEEHEDYYDEELLASFADVFSMDILS